MQTIHSGNDTFYKWQIGASTYLAWPERGARLMNWDIQLANNNTRNILYWPSHPDYTHPAKIRGGNPILFPFVARCFENGKENYWKDPQGIVRPMPRHGFARDGQFKIEDISDHGFLATYIPTDFAQQCYPYRYNFKVHYRFFELAFQVDLILENLSDTLIPWCAGHHFYFTLPWHLHLSRKDYTLHIPAKKALYHSADGRLTPAPDIDKTSTTSFDNPALVDCIHTKLKHNKTTFGPLGGEENVNLLIGESPVPTPWNTITTWTEKPESPFYCIEPWMGLPNSPEHKKGLHFVEPQKSEKFTVEVNLY